MFDWQQVELLRDFYFKTVICLILYSSFNPCTVTHGQLKGVAHSHVHLSCMGRELGRFVKHEKCLEEYS